MAMIDVETGRTEPILRVRSRWSALTGFGFVLFFLGSVVASNPPNDGASDAAWVANYTGGAHRFGHIATGLCLVLAGLCLLSFIAAIWRRVADRSPVPISPLPLLAAGAAAAGMAVGGVMMAGAVTDVGSGFSPAPDLLRFANDVGFLMVSIGAMLAASLSVASVTWQARTIGFFGRKMTGFGIVVSVVLLGSVFFVPIAALLLWSVVVAVHLLRSPSLS